ncbi:acyl-CoA dehydrogenase family protein [Bradyrhizobium sp. 24]|uniref:acyl-CoA dehydrogenase family protein n=1 Tax=unclassified Bradyrhizobium TaxID=2631580 RepID=UPI001FF8A623|nr:MULTISPECIES: acyl-CoA dehydrogenase family protein [unclassified Bradyrhizobium]MCK1302103.1 acyl-CoA dehydrogenase family protein [Bradyrhizobium sp. 37]MCK1379187.1 acyl-CoA dehydrogenase family protein [Bradyrhizobium sp. 24]MCK1774287.1 acyl-CoA dehydrogenase family protein [Bradyrhizobium sp. 134]
MQEDDQATPFIEALGFIQPLIADHRAGFDRDRQLHEEVFNALAEGGFFRLWLPATLGGPELSPLAFMSVVERAAALDGAVGWLVGNGGGMSRVGGYLPSHVVRSWFEDRRTFVVSATGALGAAVSVDGGFRVSGRWPFGSGAPHGTHFMGLVTIGENQAPDQPRFCCYFERKQVTIHDTWHVSGLRGTGSSDWEVRDTWVPAERMHPFVDYKPAENGVIYRLPALSTFAWTVAVVPLGIARGAIDSFVTLASGKGRLGTPGVMRDREIVQALVGRVQTLHSSARAFLIETMSELMAATDVGGHRLVSARLRLRIAAAHAGETALHIVDILAREAGAAAIFESGPLERAVRDVHAATKHIAMNPSIYVTAGRVELGLEAATARF